MIDILLATYNGEKYIDKQLKSLLTQDRDGLGEELRLVIRDDGSTDRTMQIINWRLDYYRNRRKDLMPVKIVETGTPTGSASGNFLELLSCTSADYVMFSDQDDMWYRRKVKVTLTKMKALETKYGKDMPLLVHTDLALMDDEGRKIADSFYDYQKLPKSDHLKNLLIQNTVTGCTVMINRAAAKLLQKAPSSEMCLMYDHYAAVLVAATGKISFVDDTPIRYRQHSGNVVGAHAAGSADEYLARFGKGRKQFLEDMDNSYRQAGYILKRYENVIREAHGEETVTLLREYSNLLMATKLERMEFFQKHDIYKNGALKKAIQLLWC